MRTHLRPFVFAALVLLSMSFARSGRAQDSATPPKPPPTPISKLGPVTPLKVQIVISRYQGDKKVSSLPYSLLVNANDGVLDVLGNYQPHGGPTRLRTGAEVPVPTLAVAKESPGQGPAGPVSYKSIGTNIDCVAHSTDDGRFRVSISIEDSSVYTEGQAAQGAQKPNAIPSFRSFQSRTTVILKDGQSTQFTAAADKINGEVTKIDVTIMVEK